MFDLVYHLPAPAWWPGPGGGPVPGYKHLVCVSHAWRKLPALASNTGNYLTLDAVNVVAGVVDQGYISAAVALQSLGISKEQYDEAVNFIKKYRLHFDLEVCVGSLRTAGGSPADPVAGRIKPGGPLGAQEPAPGDILPLPGVAAARAVEEEEVEEYGPVS